MDDGTAPKRTTAETAQTDDQEGARRIFRASLGILAGMVVAGMFWGPSISVSLLLGGGIALANLRLLHVVASRATARTPRRGSFLALFGLVVRYILLFVALYVIFTAWQLSVVATVIGLSIPVLAVGLEAARALRREFGTNRK